MSENIITDRKTAVALVKYERDRNKVVYPEYIAANAVTVDTVSAHVAALQALAFPTFDPKTADDEDKYVRKTFGNRVRNGLNFHLGKRPERKAPEQDSDADGESTEVEESTEAEVTVTPVGAFVAAVEAFRAAGYSLSDARAVLADIYGGINSENDA